MAVGKSQKQKGAHKGGTEKLQQSSLCFIDGLMSSKEFRVGATIPEVPRKGLLRGDIVRDDSGAYAVFTEQGSSASQMTAEQIIDVIARQPACDGQAADAISAYTQVKMEDAQTLI